MTLLKKCILEEIKDIVECCICNETFTDPRTLPCMHTFCLSCLQKTESLSSKKPGEAIPCPVCRRKFVLPFAGISGLQKNFFMKRLVETTRTPRLFGPCEVHLVHKKNLLSSGVPCAKRHESLLDGHERQSHSRSDLTVTTSRNLSPRLKEEPSINVQGSRDGLELKVTAQMEDSKDGRNISLPLNIRSDCDNDQSDWSKDSEDLSRWTVNNKTDCFIQRIEKLEKNFMNDVETAEKDIDSRCSQLKSIVDLHAVYLRQQLTHVKEKGFAQLTRRLERQKEMMAERMSNDSVEKWLEVKGPTRNSILGETISTIRGRNSKKPQESFQNQSDMSPEKVSFSPVELDKFLESNNILGKIRVVYPIGICLEARVEVPAFTVCGLSRMKHKIYVLCQSPNSIRCYDDDDPYVLRKEIKLTKVKTPCDMVAHREFNLLYVADKEKNCAWKVKVRRRRVTRWLSGIGSPWTLSISITGHVVMVRNGQPSSLEIYGHDGKLVRCVHLSIDFENLLHVVETSTGSFILSHKWKQSRTWAVTELDIHGQVVRRFCPVDKSQELNNPLHLSLDSDDRVFVADYYNHRVIVLEADLRSTQVLVNEDAEDMQLPLRLSYDRDKGQLMVSHGLLEGNVNVYRVNANSML